MQFLSEETPPQRKVRGGFSRVLKEKVNLSSTIFFFILLKRVLKEDFFWSLQNRSFFCFGKKGFTALCLNTIINSKQISNFKLVFISQQLKITIKMHFYGYFYLLALLMIMALNELQGISSKFQHGNCHVFFLLFSPFPTPLNPLSHFNVCK